MIIFAENPDTASEGSQMLALPASDYTPMCDEYFPHFGKFSSLDEIEDRLMAMDEMGMHLANDRDIAYRSSKLAEIVGMIRDTGHPALFTTLTREYGLREAVLNILKETVMKHGGPGV